jgi:hypothetical protein
MDADTAVTSLSFSDPAFVCAQGAGQPSRISWGPRWKAKSFPSPGMDFVDMRFDLFKIPADAIDTYPEGG